MAHVRARSLSASDESKTRINRTKHVRQLSGPIDGDLAATVSFSKLSISALQKNDVLAQQQVHAPSQPFFPGQLLPYPTSTTSISEDTGGHADNIMMDDSSMPITTDSRTSPRRPSATMNSQPALISSLSSTSGIDVSILSSIRASAPHGQSIGADTSMVTWTGSSVTSAVEAVNVNSPPAGSPNIPPAALDIHYSGLNPDEHSLTTSSPSEPSSWDDAMRGETSPKASSPLPPSSMPASPATSLGSPSSRKSHASPQDSSVSSPVLLSPRSMSVDGSRASSPVKSAESDMLLSMKRSSRRLVASSPPPSSILGKRPGSEDGYTPETMGGSSPVKRIRMNDTSSSSPPTATTRRQTATSQQRSRKKLVTPFRSPAVVRTTSPALAGQKPANPSNSSPPLLLAARPVPPNAAKTMSKLAMSSRAAAHFKSPMAARSAGGARSLVLPTATIQALERKVTTLRRAIKIKRDEDEEKLAALAKKWREAGREAAYELWDIVRDLVPNSADTPASGSDNWRSGWGWDGKDEPEVENAEDDAMKVDEEEEKPEETLGIMLRKLGIDPETLGWNDALESFVD